MNVVVNEKALERARRVSGERTYSGTINKALDEMLRRRSTVGEVFDHLQELAKDGPLFEPGYEEEVRPREYSLYYARKKRISADEKRAPRKGARRRDSR